MRSIGCGLCQRDSAYDAFSIKSSFTEIHKKVFDATLQEARMECAKYKFDDAVSKRMSYIFDGRSFLKKIKINNASAFMQKC